MFNLGPMKNTYLTHSSNDSVILKAATGDNIAKETIQVLKKYNSLKSLKAVLVDNTVTNTGTKRGMVYLLMKDLGRKLHLIGCSLHFNELPLRALFKALDGVQKSATSFSGPIGLQLEKGINERPIVQFTAIPCTLDDMSDEVKADLSTDQNLLLLFMLAISEGRLDGKLASRQIGPLNHSRWLTFAIRLLSLYCRTPNPDKALIIMVNFIQQVYGKYWFRYKKQTSFLEAPKILFSYIQDCKNLQVQFVDSPIWKTVEEPIQRNAYCLYGENFLASLLFSDQEEHRNHAIDTILTIRESAKEMPLVVGSVSVPTIDYEAPTWDKMVDTNSFLGGECHSPPCLNDVEDSELEAMRLFSQAVPAPDYPIHSQSVERSVQLVSQAVKKHYSWEKQHASILAKVKSRKVRKRFSSKKHYQFGSTQS